jgi:ABC-type sulfate transport system substrate-binding protein
MPIALSEQENGKVLTVDLVGTLAKEDYRPLAEEFLRLATKYGKIRVFLDMTRFHGWDMAALWQEIKFDVQHLNKMERLAVVGEKRWQQAIAAASKPFTSAEVRYFNAADGAQARQWLAER